MVLPGAVRPHSPPLVTPLNGGCSGRGFKTQSATGLSIHGLGYIYTLRIYVYSGRVRLRRVSIVGGLGEEKLPTFVCGHHHHHHHHVRLLIS